MSILTGPAIRAAIEAGVITIAPLDLEQVAQASVDLHLGPRVLVADRGQIALDVRDDNAGRFEEERVWRGLDGDAHLFLPGRLYLASTVERIHAPHHVAVVDGKSSLARLGLQVHLTAGYIEPGFCGQITLEIVTALPLRIPVGWPICQVRFSEVTGQVEAYTARGSYADATATDGPQTSRSYRHKPRHVRQTP